MADTAQLLKEHSHAFQNTLNTTQTDSDPVLDAAKADVHDKQPRVDTEVETEVDEPKPATETEPPVAEPAESPIGSAPIARESQISVGPKNETATGEKRDLDSTVTPVPIAQDKGEEKLEPSGEPDTKKLKTDEKPVMDSNGTAVAPLKTDDGEQKKANRPKKEKIKEAVKKIIPGEGIGSRTRSRTKGA